MTTWQLARRCRRVSTRVLSPRRTLKPHLHAKGSVLRWGGQASDYQPVHDFIDSSKAHLGDVRHRALLHSTFGIYIVERVFGTTLVNSAGKTVSVRDVAEQHVLEDMGTIPTPADWLRSMPLAEWMGGIHRLPKDHHARRHFGVGGSPAVRDCKKDNNE